VAKQDELTERNIGRWDKIFATRAWGRYPPEELVRFIAREFRQREMRCQLSVLEVGCGPGANVWFLVREGFSVAAIDGSSHAIRSVYQRLTEEGFAGDLPHVDLKVGNFASLPWPDENFDAVIDIEALYANTRETIALAVSEIRRVLKPGGKYFGKLFGIETSGTSSGRLIEAGTSENARRACGNRASAHVYA
jgi:ubiquinone/menaquinone biosynthesis C-methylase UbiE